MRAFDYASPTTKEQAISLLGTAWEQAELLAGGTDLLALMKDDVVHPKRLVNVKEIEELRGVTSGVQGMQIAAATTLGDLADNANVLKSYPALSEALNEAASPQIRNLATIAGNVCQRPRCWYFRNGFGLVPKDTVISAGDNRYHAILGNSGPAKFVSPSSIVPVLIAYGAKVKIVGPQGTRELALEKFFVIPKNTNEREHDLKPNEIVAEITLPPSDSVQAGHYEIRQKEAFDWPLAVAAVALRMNGATVQSARVVMGHVAPVPWVSPEAAKALVGKSITEATAKAAADAALQHATPLSRNAYKIQLARVAVKRAILKAGSGGAA